MKILQINSDYPFGSTGKITKSIHDGLIMNGIDSYVIYGRKNDNYEGTVFPSTYSILSKINHFMCFISGNKYGNCYFSTKRVKKIILTINPDVVHLQCINGYFVNICSLLKWLSNKNIPMILTLHAEFMYTGGCDHAFECDQWKNQSCKNCEKKWRISSFRFINRSYKVFKEFEKAYMSLNPKRVIITSVSDWMKNRAQQSPLVGRFENVVIHNMIDCNCFYYKKTFTKSDAFIFYPTTEFYPDDSDHNKGGHFILQIANMLIKRNISIKIFVAANYYHSISLPNNVILLGRITDQNELSQYYSNALVTLITSKRESFGMTLAESLCCGTPVIGFECGGPESIGMENAFFVKYGDVNELANMIEYMYLDSRFWNDDYKEKCSNNAKKHFSQESIVGDYICLYKKILGI